MKTFFWSGGSIVISLLVISTVLFLGNTLATSFALPDVSVQTVQGTTVLDGVPYPSIQYQITNQGGEGLDPYLQITVSNYQGLFSILSDSTIFTGFLHIDPLNGSTQQFISPNNAFAGQNQNDFRFFVSPTAPISAFQSHTITLVFHELNQIEQLPCIESSLSISNGNSLQYVCPQLPPVEVSDMYLSVPELWKNNEPYLSHFFQESEQINIISHYIAFSGGKQQTSYQPEIIVKLPNTLSGGCVSSFGYKI